MLEMIDRPVSEPENFEFAKQAQSIRMRYDALTHEQKSLRARDVAKALGVSEANWVSASCGPLRSIRLSGAPQAIFKELGTLGRVMALTRNDSCVHERHGEYADVQADGPVGLVLGSEIDLRAFFGAWEEAFAVQEGSRCSLQFFDKAGHAIHKIYCTNETDVTQYLALVQKFARLSFFSDPQTIEKEKLPDTVKNVEQFRQAWLAIKDTHDFFGVLKKFNVSRMGALRHAGASLAQCVHQRVIEQMLCHVALEQLSIMCFVANHAMIQIHTGTVKNIKQIGSWLNVLDPTFNLHLNTADIRQVWVVNKPTVDGWVTSLEVFDSNDQLIVQFFGARKPGQPELKPWRALMVSLCPKPLLG